MDPEKFDYSFPEQEQLNAKNLAAYYTQNTVMPKEMQTWLNRLTRNELQEPTFSEE